MAEIIDIGDSRFQRKRGQYCQHKHLEYSVENLTVECKDCQEIIGGFRAFLLTVAAWERDRDNLEARRKAVEELEVKSQIRLLKATAKVNEAWRRRNMVPCCPHCHEAIFPEDGFGDSLTNKQMEIEARRFKNKPVK